MIITTLLECCLDKANPGGAATTHKRSFFKKSPPRIHELLRSLLLLFSFAISPLPTSLQPVFGDEDDDKIPPLLQSCSLHNPAPAPSGNTRQLRQAMTSGACLLQTRRYITPIQTLSSSLHTAECVTVAIAKFCSQCSPERYVIATENALAALDRRAIPFLLTGADAPAASRSPEALCLGLGLGLSLRAPQISLKEDGKMAVSQVSATLLIRQWRAALRLWTFRLLQYSISFSFLFFVLGSRPFYGMNGGS
jgi:hypothetical protein